MPSDFGSRPLGVGGRRNFVGVLGPGSSLAHPARPVDLAHPVDPARPVDPAHPVDLAHPVDPARPVDPATLVDPVP